MKIKLLAISIIMIGLSNISNAQNQALEKSYEVTNRAKRGFLENIEINKDNGNIDVLYALPNALTTKRDLFLSTLVFGAVTANKAKYEIYSYDKDLNLIGTSREEERVYFEPYPEYSYTTAEPTLRASCLCLSFKQVEVKAEYNWFSGYKKTTKVIDKKKAQSEDDNNYSFTGRHYELPSEKSILVLAGKKIKKDMWSAYTKYDILSVDNELNMKATESFELEFGSVVIYSSPLKDEKAATNDELARDWIMVFAPMKASKGTPNDFTYFRINPEGKIVERLVINSPSNGWNIEGSYEKNGSVYLYGSSISIDPSKKYYEDVVKKGWNELTATHYQLAKITKGKLDYITATALSDISAKQATPSNQKKPLEIDGKTYQTTGIRFLESGDVIFTYQDYEIKDGEVHVAGGTYKSVYLFQYDVSGAFKKSFGVDINPDLSNVKKVSRNTWEHLPADHYFYPSVDGKRMYWFIRSAKDVASFGSSSAEHNDIVCKPMNGIDYGSINFETGEISEFKTIGEDKKPYYLFSKTSGTQLGNFIYFFSETEKGDKMLLSRIDISK